MFHHLSLKHRLILYIEQTHTCPPPLKQTHVNGVPLEDAKLQEELQLDLPLLEELLHLGLGLV